MRIKVVSSKEVYDADTAENIWRQIHESSDFVKHQSLKDYYDGAIVRLQDIKIYLEPPEAARQSDKSYSEWMLRQFIELGRMCETDEPTTIEQKAEAERKKAEAAKARAAKTAATPAAKATTAGNAPAAQPGAKNGPDPTKPAS